MKVSIKWILVLTLLVCLPMSLNNRHVSNLIAIGGAAMLLLLPIVAFSKWKIDDEDGWWKFKGSPIARFVVWFYAISAFLILVSAIRLFLTFKSGTY